MSEAERADFLDAIVVGAGLSGLVCARDLARAGVSLAVLEARERVGGRTLSAPLGAGIADLGGQWVAPTQRRVIALAEELGIALSPQYREGRSVLVGGAKRRLFLPRIRLVHALELVYRMRQLERMCDRIPADAPDMARRAAEWDSLTLAQWLERRVRTRDARAMISLIGELKLAAAPTEPSLLCFLDFVRASGGLINVDEFPQTGAQEARLVGGAQSLCQALAAGLGRRVYLGEAVSAIDQGEDGCVHVESAAGPWRARRVILALPPSLAERISFRPGLPAARARVQRRARMGPIIKFGLAYDRPFWRNAGLSGESYSVEGVVRATTDDCSHDGAQAALAAFVVGDRARELSALGVAERRRLVLDDVARLLGDAAGTPIDFREMDWAADEWSRGCVTFFGPGVLSECHGALRAPFGRVHFAGAESAREWHGHLEGAVEAGERAAEEVLSARLERVYGGANAW